MMRNKEAKALYIHIPFCERICDYCDFAKLQYFRNFAINYLDSLKNELEQYRPYGVETIYVGGGTPTSLEDDLFLKLLEMIKPYSKEVIEYTFEANPESLSLDKLRMMKEFGVNRLSIGVESTNDKILTAINRNHTFKDVKNAVRTAKEVGFDNLNVDLIIGLPNVSKVLLIKDIDNILSLDVNHISCYGLTVHPNTVFFNKHIEEPSGDDLREYYDIVEAKLKENGFIHYEISNWCKPGFESKHNYIYWKDERYYGLGLGASGYLKDKRYINTRNIQLYNKKQYIAEEEMVDKDDDKTYFIMLNLRTIRGIIFQEYQDRFNEDFYKKYEEIIKSLVKDNLIQIDEDRIYPTYDGMMILDQLIMKFIEE